MHTLRSRYFRTTLLASLALSPVWAHADTKLIPLPASMQVLQGTPLTLTNRSQIAATGDAAAEAQFLAKQLRAATGFPVPVTARGNGAITLTLDTSLKDALGEEGYRLRSSDKGVSITAATRAGLFYGGQTLRGLLPPQAMRSKPVAGERVAWTVPAVSIDDKPRFAWRGFMQDEARQFFGMDYMKKLIDNMAARKFNILHWHLTDDEGWRVEIKSLPKLAEVAAWRGSETAIPNVRGEQHTRYGGYYTQDQIREIVAYAKERHIDVMPEIDLPGHALALVRAYPEAAPSVVADGVSATGFSGNVISPTRAEALALVDKIYDEVTQLFPFEYIHIGGDEVNHGMWSKDPQIKATMEKEGLKNLHEVQVMFTKRLEGVVARRAKKLFGWNEIMDDRLAKGTGIMAWTHAAPGYQAARRGYPVVMMPGVQSYFDMGYGGATGEPQSHSWAGDVTLQRIYSFDPRGDGGNLSAEEQARIIGVQAALWAEFVRPWEGDIVNIESYSQAAEYKIWPRLLATAEVAWTPQEKRYYADFASRLDADEFQRLENAGIAFRVPVPELVELRAGTVEIKGPFAGADVRTTFDGTIPTPTSPRYEKPFALEGRDASRLRVRTFFNGRGGTIVVGAKAAPVGRWNEKQLRTQAADFTYDATGNLSSSGVWRAVFRRTGGDKPLHLQKIVVLADGIEIATADETAITNRGDRAVARFEVPTLAPNAKVEIVATLTGPEGDNSRGEVTLVKSERLEPTVKVSSTYPAYGGSSVAGAGDWDDDTNFWIADFPRPGVLAMWTFDQPLSVRKVSVPTGERNGTKDQLVGGDLEISEDGTTFRKIASYTYGNAEAELPAGTTIKAIRVVATETQKTWTILRDPVLR